MRVLKEFIHLLKGMDKKVFKNINFQYSVREKIELKQQIHCSLKKKCLMMQYME